MSVLDNKVVHLDAGAEGETTRANLYADGAVMLVQRDERVYLTPQQIQSLTVTLHDRATNRD